VVTASLKSSLTVPFALTWYGEHSGAGFQMHPG
jgi:hypothetical protein